MNIRALEEKFPKTNPKAWCPWWRGDSGSVGTGAVDPLDEIADVCKKQDCWFHIDGAYGGIAAALPELRPIFKGAEKADSIAIDPHKWLYSPLEAGAVLVRDAGHSRMHSVFILCITILTEKKNRKRIFTKVDFRIQGGSGIKSLAYRLAGAEGHIG
jgi:selenocysteine lyase/cysteine desulfurase